MPWQAVPPLVIIGGAFAVSGLLLNGFDRLTLGRVRDIVVIIIDYLPCNDFA